MTRARMVGFAWVLTLTGLAPATAAAQSVCGTIDEFNAAMADAGTSSPDVTLTFDVVGINPNDFAGGGKGSIAQMRNTLCATGQDAVIKVYGPDDPPNDAHPSGTLKMEHGNSCCPGDCGEQWADPNASAAIFVDGTEQCNVTMWINPTDVGYSLACNVGQFDAIGENPLQNQVDRVAVLEYFLADGGTTWELPNATASNVEVCWESVPSDEGSITVPVLEDVTAGPSWPDTVFPDPTDLAVEAGDATAYLKFEVPPIDGEITRVRLFMQTSTAPSSDGDGGEVHVVTDNAWSEATMTGNTRPGYEAASLGRIGPAAADTLVSLELGTVIDAGGTYGFAIVSPPTDGNGTHFWSKEGSPSEAAYLKIDYVMGADGGGDGTTDEGGDVGSSGDVGSEDGGLATDGADSEGDDGGVLPSTGGTGLRGADTGCGCTTSRSSEGWLFVLGVVALARRRRR